MTSLTEVLEHTSRRSLPGIAEIRQVVAPFWGPQHGIHKGGTEKQDLGRHRRTPKDSKLEAQISRQIGTSQLPVGFEVFAMAREAQQV